MSHLAHQQEDLKGTLYLNAACPFIQSLAEAGGGSVVSDPAAIWRSALPPVYDARSLADLFWLLALLLLPVDVASRRLVIRRSSSPQPAVTRSAAQRLGVASRRWTASRPDFRPSCERVRAVVGGQGAQPVPVAGSVRSTASSVRMGPRPGPRPPGERSTAGRLLEAKRRRQAEGS